MKLFVAVAIAALALAGSAQASSLHFKKGADAHIEQTWAKQGSDATCWMRTISLVSCLVTLKSGVVTVKYAPVSLTRVRAVACGSDGCISKTVAANGWVRR